MSVEELVLALNSSDPEERRLAAGRLANSGPVDLLLQALRDVDWRVREEARQAARLRAPDPELLEALVEVMASPEELGAESVGLRNAAVDVLGAFGDAAVRALADKLPHMDADGRKLAVEALAGTTHPSALTVLRMLLDDADSNVRAAALEAVADLGTVSVDEAVAILQACLDDTDQFVQLIALNGLNQLGASLPWGRLQPLLHHTILRRAVLEAAGRSGASQAADVLADQMTAQKAAGPEFQTTLRAMAILAQRGLRGREALAARLRTLPGEVRQRLLKLASADNDDLVTRRYGVTLLGLLGGEDAARVAVESLADDRVLEEAEVAVCELGEAATTVLARAVQTSEGGERAAALELLGRVAADLGEAARGEAIRVIQGRLNDPSLDVVRSALDVLGEMGDASSLPAVASMLAQTTDPLLQRTCEAALAALASRWPEEAWKCSEDPNTGRYASLALVAALGPLSGRPGQSLPSRQQCVQRLCGGLSDPCPAVRRLALEGLGGFGEASCAKEVAFALTDEEPEVRVAAVQTLGRLRDADGTPVGLDQLLTILHSGRDPELVAKAAEAIGDLGHHEALEALAPLAHGAEPRIAVAAVEAIARLPAVRRLDTLRPALDHPSAEVVKATLRVIGSEREPRVLVHVGRFLDHESWDVRRQAADVLGRLGGEAEIQLLRSKLESEEEPLVREALQRALEELGAIRRTPLPQPGSHRIR